MSTPEITIAIADEVYRPAANGDAAETFGATFAPVTFRCPSFHDVRVKIPALTAAALTEAGAGNPHDVAWTTYQFTEALTFFQVLGVDLPGWLDAKRPWSPKGDAAILSAYQRALAQLGEEKKGGGAASGATSTTR